MALTANKVSSGPIVTHRTIGCRSHERHNFLMPIRNYKVQLARHGMPHGQLNHICLLAERSTLSSEGLGCIYGKSVGSVSKKSSFLCKSSGTNNTGEKDCRTTFDDISDLAR